MACKQVLILSDDHDDVEHDFGSDGVQAKFCEVKLASYSDIQPALYISLLVSQPVLDNFTCINSSNTLSANKTLPGNTVYVNNTL